MTRKRSLKFDHQLCKTIFSKIFKSLANYFFRLTGQVSQLEWGYSCEKCGDTRKCDGFQTPQ